jgi:CheY-like chemotaxis protein
MSGSHSHRSTSASPNEPITALLDDLVDKYSNMSFASCSNISYAAEIICDPSTLTGIFTVPHNVQPHALLDWIWEHRRDEFRKSLRFRRFTHPSSEYEYSASPSSSSGNDDIGADNCVDGDGHALSRANNSGKAIPAGQSSNPPDSKAPLTTTTLGSVAAGSKALLEPNFGGSSAHKLLRQRENELMLQWSREIQAPATLILRLARQLHQDTSSASPAAVDSDGKIAHVVVVPATTATLTVPALVAASERLQQWIQSAPEYAALEKLVVQAAPTNVPELCQYVVLSTVQSSGSNITIDPTLSTLSHSPATATMGSALGLVSGATVMANTNAGGGKMVATRYDAAVPESISTDGTIVQRILGHLIQYAHGQQDSISSNGDTQNTVQLRLYAGTKSAMEVALRRRDDPDEEGTELVQETSTSTATTTASTNSTLSSSGSTHSSSTSSSRNADRDSNATFLRFVVRYDASHRAPTTASSTNTPNESTATTPWQEMGAGVTIASRLVQLLGSQLHMGDSPVGDGTDFSFDVPFTGGTAPANVALLAHKLKNATVLFVGDVSHGELALTALARAGIDIVQVDNCSELLVLIESKTAIDPHRIYMCLMQENLYQAQTFRLLATVARSVLLTFGPHRLVRDGKRHFVSLDRTLPSLVLETMVACLKIAAVASPTPPPPHAAKPPRPTKRVVSDDSLSTTDTKQQPSFDLSAVKVLIAEDNRINQKVLVRMLKRLGMKHIDVVTDGKQAVESCLKNTYDIVFVDNQMPVMDGLEACRRIKQQQQQHNSGIVVNNDDEDSYGDDGSGPAIVFVTANTTEEFRKDAYLAGGTGFISKPFDIRAIEAYFKTQTKLRRTQSAPANASPKM